jgi:pyridoxine 5-phosphate synthase
MTRLSVNLNKVALVRNQRPLGVPGVARLGGIALAAGARGLTLHPRPDGRHALASDVADLASLVAGHPDAELNVEGNPFHNLVPIVLEHRPHQATLVPDAEGASTSDHGWNLGADGTRLEPLVRRLRDAGVRVSLFMDPEPGTMKAAADLGAHRIELYTEPWAGASGTPSASRVLARYAEAAQAALDAGLGVNAGHDLNLDNLPPFVATVPGVLEVSIGHALTADALEFGMAGAVARYVAALAGSRTP